MFTKVLIANRGEIACRVIRTLRRLGVGSVAVYSDADRDALHTISADESVRIGSAPSAESYLVIERIVEACVQTGAEAVHPGYGFLSENSRLLSALDSSGIIFVGPGKRAIEVMGDKIASKKLAATAGVNIIPGYDEVLCDAGDAVEKAASIGYPVMLKASAGGGGKGMRVALNEVECREGFERAQNEARTSFGDDRVFIEKLIDRPRHIEIQVLGDRHGNCVYLNERECSVQRRHQKVIEEAPSPFIDEDTRREMGQQAVALARAVDYFSAGTVEFIVDQAQNFYFLEMNTRLQVEHPVTEFITGLDLVEMMLRIAAGEALPISQSDIGIKGWAIESRIYAENAARDFVPSTGRLIRYHQPPESDSVRVDSGVTEGSEVSVYYDPLMAKLVCHGSNRDEAIALMGRSLDRFHVDGVTTNIPFLAALMSHPRFVAGDITTGFIAEEYPEGFIPPAPTPHVLARIVALIAVVYQRSVEQQVSISSVSAAVGLRVVRVADASYSCTVEPAADGYTVAVDDQILALKTTWSPGDAVTEFRCEGKHYFAQVKCEGIGYTIFHGGLTVTALVLEADASRLYDHMPVKIESDQSHLLLSPMSGLLISVAVAAGDAVHTGQALAVVEAMKMENILRAERDCVIAVVRARPGDTLELDQPLLEFETAEK